MVGYALLAEDVGGALGVYADAEAGVVMRA